MVRRPLTLINLTPDRDAFARWSVRHTPVGRKSGLSEMPDSGYAWHGILRSAFGKSAPKPFVDRMPLRSNLLLGYVEHEPGALPIQSDLDPLVARAMGIETLRATEMPADWEVGQELSFEVRVRPVVRTREHARSGRIDEMDAAVHAAKREPSVSREQAYRDWLMRELDRDGAGSLGCMRTIAFQRSRVIRRDQATPRKAACIEGPDLWLNGRLTVNSAEAFEALLRRGLGRHRAFGFGCLLVGRPGVLDQ